MVFGIHQAQKLLRSGEVTPIQLVQQCLEKIQSEDSRLRAFITVMREEALDLAEKQTKILKTCKDRENLPALFGIPIAVKDLIEVAGVRTTAGSLFWKDFVSLEDAFVVRKLKEAGAVIIGKTNLHEIALGVTNSNPHYGICRNPCDPTRISGGSSGGSAVAVAAEMTLGALGTDTGGSIRIPSALCGVVGLKPTYGRISLRGVFPLAWHLDHVGPITSCVQDAAILLSVMDSYDRDDPFSSLKRSCLKPVLTGDVANLRIARSVGRFVETSDPEILDALEMSTRVFKDLGAQIVEYDIDWLRDVASANGLMTQVEAAAFHEERLYEHPEWFGDDVRERLNQGLNKRGVDYAFARHTQTLAKHRFTEFFKEHDLLLLPTTSVTAPPVSEDNMSSVQAVKPLTRFTAPFDITGLPAITVPFGKSKSGLPIAVQLVGNVWAEAKVLNAAFALEKAIQSN